MPVLQVKRPKGELISRKYVSGNVPHKGTSMQRPTFLWQNILDSQVNVSYIADNKK